MAMMEAWSHAKEPGRGEEFMVWDATAIAFRVGALRFRLRIDILRLCLWRA